MIPFIKLFLIRRASPRPFLSRLHFILLEVFKCSKTINRKCMNNLFEVKQHDHWLRDGTRLLQLKVRTTTHRLPTISYLGAKLWNDLPVDMKKFIIWINTNSNLCFYCGRAPIDSPLINVICDMLNRDQIPLTGRGEEYMHIHICFYYFYVNLYEYDVYILWCFICCMHLFGLYRAGPGIHCSLDARLGLVQIRVIPHIFSIYLCLNFVCIALCIILHYLSVAH